MRAEARSWWGVITACAVVLSGLLACGGEPPASVAPDGEPPASAASDRWVIVPDPQAAREPLAPADASKFGFRPGYRFSEDWLSKRVGYWVAMLQPYMGKPGVQYLEVGVFEGRSFVWMLDHVLTQPDSYATGIEIDPLPALEHNLEVSGAKERVNLIVGSSQLELRKLAPATYDVVYIDGSHMADDVLEDIVLSWRLLKPGGLMILDDYEYTAMHASRGIHSPPELLPRIAVDAFISTFRDSVHVVLKDYQVALRKRKWICMRKRWQCSTLGGYSYDWRLGVLYKDGSDVPLSDDERKVVEALIKSKQGDALTLRLHRDFVELPLFRDLDARLGLGLREAVEHAPRT